MNPDRYTIEFTGGNMVGVLTSDDGFGEPIVTYTSRHKAKGPNDRFAKKKVMADIHGWDNRLPADHPRSKENCPKIEVIG